MKNKKIILGITGSIAAYKCCELIHRLKDKGAEVFCVLTPNAEKFITPLTLSTLTERRVYTDLSPKKILRDEGKRKNKSEVITSEIEHIDLARIADLILVVPASANTINKLSWGIADNLLTSVILATDAPVLVAPAMNSAMYNNPLTQESIARLKQIRGFYFLGPVKGMLACGEKDIGRLIEIDKIVEKTFAIIEKKEKSKLKGKKVLITAGPTREYIDPIRFISNASSGKMGYYLAQEISQRGGKVTLISGPTQIPVPEKIKTFEVITSFVNSAEEMFAKVKKLFPSTDIYISAAAVSDYRPEKKFKEKIKKEVRNLNLPLVRNPDILAEMGEKKEAIASPVSRRNKILVGFALGDKKSLAEAKQKLKEKNLDLLVLNPPEVMGKEETQAYFLYPNKKMLSFSKLYKRDLAVKITDEIEKLI